MGVERRRVDRETGGSVANLPVVDEAYTRQIFDDLALMQVSLDGDPLAYGPKRLQKKIASCRDYLTRCQQFFLQLSSDLHQVTRAHRQAKLDFDLRMQDMFANDPEVRAGRNVRDREAVAHTKLRTEREHIFHLETSIQDLESVLLVVKAKREDLKNIQAQIRDQMKLCQEEIGLGARWGTAVPPGEPVPNLEARPLVDTNALAALQREIEALESESESGISDLERFVQQEVGERPEPPKAKTAGPVPAPVISKTSPPVEPSEAPASTEPKVEMTPTKVTTPVAALPATSQSSEVDDFFSGVDVEPKARANVTGVSSEIDLDDLIGDMFS